MLTIVLGKLIESEFDVKRCENRLRAANFHR